MLIYIYRYFALHSPPLLKIKYLKELTSRKPRKKVEIYKLILNLWICNYDQVDPWRYTGQIYDTKNTAKISPRWKV